jgi:inosine-uridine nucleoside N-ribohydrolase
VVIPEKTENENLLSDSKRISLVIDTDAGPDDMMAIAFLLCREDVEIEAITVTNGLAHVETGGNNICRLLELAGRTDILVAIGRDKPLKGDRAFPDAWRRSTDQIPNVNLPETAKNAEKRDAVECLLDRLKDSVRPVTVLSLGPLTNLGDLFIQNPMAFRSIHEIIFMGGAMHVPGNIFDVDDFISPSDKVEWNMFVDPLADKLVFSSGTAILVVSLDATNTVKIDSAFVNAFNAAAGKTVLGHFVGQMLESVKDFVDRGIYYAWDPLAAVSVVDQTVLHLTEAFVEIETDGPHAGQTREVEGGVRKIRLASSADPERFMEIFTRTLGKSPK